jgi:hypothetical protein
MPSTTFTIERDGEPIELDIDYEVAPYIPPSGMSGPPEFSDPGHGGEVTSLTAYRNGHEFKLTDAETEKVEQHIYDNHDYAEDGYDYDD